MTDRPYTDADLRAEAAHQHHALTTDLDFVSIGEQMEDRLVNSTVVQPDRDDTGSTWAELLDPEGDGTEEFVTAERAICGLIRGAADVSAWAIALGIAGLEPITEIGMAVTTGGYAVAVQIAADPGLTDDARDELITELHKAVTETASRVLGLKPTA